MGGGVKEGSVNGPQRNMVLCELRKREREGMKLDGWGGGRI